MARRRVEIKKIEDRAKRQVTFTKRRQGLFKKAEELHSKCDADVAVIAFSMAGNAYAFGDPSVQTVLDRYRNAAEAPGIGVVLRESAAERKVGEILEKAKTGGGRRVWDSEIQNLGFLEIDELRNAMEDMKKKICIQHRILLESTANPNPNPNNNNNNTNTM